MAWARIALATLMRTSSLDRNLTTRDEILAACLAIGAPEFGGRLSPSEQRLLKSVPPARIPIQELRASIRLGGDPLGSALAHVRTREERRGIGAIYTPRRIVAPMISWVMERDPGRLIDPGCGTGRFALDALRRKPGLSIIAVDTDPLATLCCRAGLAFLGAKDAIVLNADFTTLRLPPVRGITAFVGNPPYVRHHDLPRTQKRVGRMLGERLGIGVSALSGLHVHFLLNALLQARADDVFCFITSSEWLDVGYGQALRRAFIERTASLNLDLIDPRTPAFRDAMTTSLVASGSIGVPHHTVRLRKLKSPDSLGGLAAGGRVLSRPRLAAATRWRPLFANAASPADSRGMPLGELFRVSRGVATGANGFFVLTSPEAHRLGVSGFTRQVLTSAAEVLNAGGCVREAPSRRVLLTLPRDFEPREGHAVARYLAWGRRNGVSTRYLCSHRDPWWYLGAKSPPVVATYMARQPPAFALNVDSMAVLNVLHGLYPRAPLQAADLTAIVGYLNRNRDALRGLGRVYHGGLEKFEPSEMEAIRIPRLEILREMWGHWLAGCGG